MHPTVARGPPRGSYPIATPTPARSGQEARVPVELFPTPLLVGVLFVPFAVAVAGLHVILLKPMMAYLQERKQVSAQARADTERLQTSIQERLQELEAKLAQARAVATAQRSEARARAQEHEEQVLERARKQASRELAQALATLQQERQTASIALQQSAANLSTDIASKVLGRSVSA